MISRNESAQIEVVRVFCILSMMWVHVNPSLGTPSLINGGAFDYVGDLLGQTLGRISVTTLSFISGYLLWNNGRKKPFAEILRNRFLRVVVPMLFWSAIFILLAAAKEMIFDRPSTAIRGIGQGGFDIINAWSGLAGPTANESLFFLRDLFISALILRTLIPLVRSAPLVPIAIATIATVLNVGEPVVFRPIITLFMFLGAGAASRNLTITRLSLPGIALTIGFALSAVGFFSSVVVLPDSTIIERALDLLRRLGVGFLVLTTMASAMVVFPLGRVSRIGRHSFLAYLIHTPLIGIFWVFWRELIGGEQQVSYLFFYVATPFAVFLIARKLGHLLDHLPQQLQMLLRGRARQSIRLPIGENVAR